MYRYIYRKKRAFRGRAKTRIKDPAADYDGRFVDEFAHTHIYLCLIYIATALCGGTGERLF